jgi:hypothetical protein
VQHLNGLPGKRMTQLPGANWPKAGHADNGRPELSGADAAVDQTAEVLIGANLADARGRRGARA